MKQSLISEYTFMNTKLFLVACLLPVVIDYVDIGYTMELKYKQAHNIGNTNNNKMIDSIENKFQENIKKIFTDVDSQIQKMCSSIIEISNTQLLPKINQLLTSNVKQYISEIKSHFALQNNLSEIIIEAVKVNNIIQNSIEYDMNDFIAIDDFISKCKNFNRIINIIINFENELIVLVKEPIDNIIKLYEDNNNIKSQLTCLNDLYETLKNKVFNITNQINNNSKQIKELIENKNIDENKRKILNNIQNQPNI